MESSTSEECSLCRDLEECTVSSRRKKAPLIIDLLESVDHSAPPQISTLTVLRLCFLFIHFALAHFFTDALYNVEPILLI